MTAVKDMRAGPCRHSSSNRYQLQVANARRAPATFPGMETDDLTAYRIDRLEAAIKKVAHGNKSDFGRKLGYKDGAFIRQMLAGKRPITEKTILQIEGLHGMANWFAPAQAAAESSPYKIILDRSSIEGALRVLAEAASACSTTKRSSLEPLFSRLATKPEEIGEISQLVALLLGQTPGGQESSDDGRPSKPAGMDFELDTQDGARRHGTSDSAQQESGGRSGVRGVAGGSPGKRPPR